MFQSIFLQSCRDHGSIFHRFEPVLSREMKYFVQGELALDPESSTLPLSHCAPLRWVKTDSSSLERGFRLLYFIANRNMCNKNKCVLLSINFPAPDGGTRFN